MVVERKVSGGKLVRMERVGKRVQITGDFFLYPDELLATIEDICSKGDPTAAAIEQAVAHSGGKLIGVGVQDIVELYAELEGEQ